MTDTRGFMDRTLWPAVFLLAAVLVIFQFTGADLAVQDWIYHAGGGRWPVNPLEDGDPGFKETTSLSYQRMEFILHSGMRRVVAVFAVYVLVRYLIGKWWKAVAPRTGADPRRAAVVLLTIGLTIGVTGIGKKATHAFCPKQIARYGGAEEYLPTWTPYTETNRPAKYGQCWPAGHASGGFGMLAAATLARTSRGRRRGILLGLTVGWIMGGYQMLKGSHYLSDTLVTMLLAWILHLLMRRVWQVEDAPPAA